MTRSVVYKAEVTSTDDNTTHTYIGVTANDFETRYVFRNFKIPTQRKVQARNGVIQTRLESQKRKSVIFDHMGHRQANTSRQKRKTKLHSVPRGKADDQKGRSKNILNRRSEMFSKCRHVI